MVDVIFVTYKTDEKTMQRFDELGVSLDINKYNLIFTGQPASASVNRNYGLDWVTAPIVIMVDDDVSGYYEGWVDDLVEPLIIDEGIILVSARLLNPDGTRGSMMGSGGVPTDKGWHDGQRSSFRGYYRLPTAAIAFRNTGLRFNEEYLGSGYEDTEFCNEICDVFPQGRFVINNNCQLIHENRQVRQGGKYWQHNHEVYLKKFPDDVTVSSQQDWCKGIVNE